MYYAILLYIFTLRVSVMEVRVGDILEMKKPHPCGAKEFLVLRSGMDFRLRCTGCLHEIMIPRRRAEKNIRKIIRSTENPAD
jgi:hypothetical protein